MRIKNTIPLLETVKKKNTNLSRVFNIVGSLNSVNPITMIIPSVQSKVPVNNYNGVNDSFFATSYTFICALAKNSYRKSDNLAKSS